MNRCATQKQELSRLFPQPVKPCPFKTAASNSVPSNSVPSNSVPSKLTLIAVVGVDVEAEDGVDFDGLGSAGGGTEFPAGEGGYDFCGHGGGAGFEDLKIFQVSRGVEFAFDNDAGVGKVGGEIGAEALGSGEWSGAGMGVGIGVGKLHDDDARGSVDIDGVVIAGEFAVEIECAAGAGSGDDGDGGALVGFDGRAAGSGGCAAVASVKAGEIDDGAAAANIDAGGSGGSGGRGAGSAGAGGGRDSGAGVGVGAVTGTGLSCAGVFGGGFIG